MKRALLRTSAFIRAVKRLVRRDRRLADDLLAALELLGEDAFHPQLRTHKLKGEFEESWAASAGYDLRIVFEFVLHDEAEAVLLLTAGTHDEVY